jgi:DinB superfamily
VYERLQDRVAGLTDDEYAWSPAAPLTTISWRMAHIAHALREERNWRWMDREPTLSDADCRRPTTAADGIAYLGASYAAWDQLVGSLEPGELWRPMGAVAGPFAGEPIVALIAHILDELTHHAAEVALMRDLYATAGQWRS